MRHAHHMFDMKGDDAGADRAAPAGSSRKDGYACCGNGTACIAPSVVLSIVMFS
jgi:hypothetical protein